MARVRWATIRHPANSSKAILRRLSARRGPQNPRLETIGENFGGENPATHGGEDLRDENELKLEERRTIYVNVPVDEVDLDEDRLIRHRYPRNKIRTAKYTPLSFVPKNLWYQFHNVANLYFLLLVILQCFSIFGATNPGLSAVPLIVIVVITAIKDAIEDWRRTVLDNQVNNTPTRRLGLWHNANATDEQVGVWRRIKKATSRLIRKLNAQRKGQVGDPLDLDRITTRPSADMVRRSADLRRSMDLLRRSESRAHGEESILKPMAGNEYEADFAPMQHNVGDVIDKTRQTPGKAEWERTYWKNVRVGDFVRLRNDDAIPADVVVLATSEADSACYVETKNLDGETNLKIRHGLRAASKIKTPLDCEAASFIIESEGPSPHLYNYSALARWTERDELDPSKFEEKLEPISAETLLLRGCTLRNTAWVIGIVVFTGDDTKIMQNAGVTPSKRSRIARELNWTVLSNFVLLFIMCVVCGTANGIYLDDQTSTFNVFDMGAEAGGPAVAGVVTFFTCLILFQNLVPISLYISIEIVKTAQAYFIYSDLDMYHAELDYPCTPKSWNISDDLGQIEYVFSDKTGTLTQNVMEFKKCTINGIPYGEAYTEAMAGIAKRQGHDIVAMRERELQRVSEDRASMLQQLRQQRNRYLLEDELTFVSSTFIRDMNGHNGETQAEACKQFMLALALCHTVLVERDPQNRQRLIYKAQSPDEAALVATARDLGFPMPERTQRGVVIEHESCRREYVLMDELEFNSSRKRMSIIVRKPDGGIRLYCKGADSVIFARLAEDQKTSVRQDTARDLDIFANEGLRTLCIAYRDLSEQHYADWSKQHRVAAASLSNREEKIAESCDEIERELVLLGGTAIEDRLQDGVPEAIALLGEAGIKLWVLTGDKVETAINIGYSCNLLDTDMEVVQMACDKPETAASLLSMHLGKFNLVGSPEELKVARHDHAPPSSKTALVVDGDTLKLLLHDDLRTRFLLLCKQMKAVLCCRVSPAQKAEVVRMVKLGLDVMTLSIGDGANDVAMIQQADVGIGIAGVEGRQAVMSSDYAIGQFRFLTKLLLVHGRWSYRRLAEMIACFFNKNIVWTFTLFWYQIYDQFDGQYHFDYTYILLYNLAFTSLPIIFMGAFDQDVSARVSMKVPQLYMRGILRKDWRPMKFWSYMIDGLYASAICFFFPFLLYNASGRGTFIQQDGHTNNSLVELGAYIAHPTVLVVNTFVLINTSRWDWLFMLIWAISNLLLWLWTGIYAQFEANPQFYHLASHVYGSLTFWAVLLVTVVAALLPRFCIIAYRSLYAPQDADIVREQVKLGYFGDEFTGAAKSDSSEGASETPSFDKHHPGAANGSGSSGRTNPFVDEADASADGHSFSRADARPSSWGTSPPTSQEGSDRVELVKKGDTLSTATCISTPAPVYGPRTSRQQ
ncbi:phospholipid transporting ATPase [Savitreella phatthalungensis]